MSVILEAIRVHQWPKNLLILIPVIAGHKVGDINSLLPAIFAVLSFCCVASAGYLLNDLADITADRAHKIKRLRPLASGRLSSRSAFYLVAMLLILGGSIAATLLSRDFSLVLWGYFLLSLSYSLYLKKLIVVDILALAFFFSLRVFAGGVATEIPLSNWLLTFFVFLFLSMALLKRFCEFSVVKELATSEAKLAQFRRGYSIEDLPFLGMFGTVSGYLSVLVLALYISSDDALAVYSNSRWMWPLLILLLYWITRFWLLASRRQVGEDPFAYALKDGATYSIAFLSALILYISA